MAAGAESGWDPARLPDLGGRRYLVTGSTAGLGFFASSQLAAAGAQVVMSGRNPNRLAAAKSAVLHEHPDASVETLLLDTSNLGSVRAAAASVRGRAGLDGLLLNAGIVHPPAAREETLDRHELVLATNVLGHYALAGSLLTPLASRGGRMVWVGSVSTSLWRYDPRDPELTEGYSAWRAYVQSKAMVSALAFEADAQLREMGVPAASLLAHPGYSLGGRTRGIRTVNQPSRLTRFAANLQGAVAQSKEHGAWPLVRALVDPAAKSGEFWGPGLVVRGAPRRATAAGFLRDPELRRRVWEFCQRATGETWPFARAARARRR